MADWEKVKKGLENCLKGFDCPPECPYLHDCHDLMKPMFVELAKDVLALLKEQNAEIRQLKLALEPVKPVLDEKCPRIYLCGNCGFYVGFEDHDDNDPNEYDNFCRKCGTPVLWKGR